MPMQFELPPMALLGPLLAAVGIYGLLRWVVWVPGGGTSPKSVSDHALWVGVIGWLASTLQGAANAGIIPLNPQTPSLQQPADILAALAWPVAGCLGVHALGQLSYPGPRSSRRLATLAVRQVRDFLPRKLTWTTLGIFAASAATIAWAAMQPAYRPVPYTSPPFGEAGPLVGGDGRIPGTELAACLGGALLLLAAGTVLVLWLISRRRQLEALDAGDNVLLRTIAMNRLLRTVSTVAAGLASIAANFAARPDPAVATDWINPGGLLPVVVLFVMWLWQPPQLASVGPRNARPRSVSASASASGRKNVRSLGSEKHPAAVLTVSLGALLGLAAVAPGLAVLFLLGTTNPARATVVSAVMAVCVLLAILAGELLLARNYGASSAVHGWPVQPVAPALLTAAIIATLVLAVVTVMTSVGEAALGSGTPGAPGWITTAVATAAVAVTAVPATLAVRRRRGIVTPDDGLDAALRAVTLNRIVRILAAFLLAQAGGLLISGNRAWGALLGMQTVPAEAWEGAAAATGYVLLAAAVGLSLIRVTAFGPRSAPAARHAPVEPAR